MTLLLDYHDVCVYDRDLDLFSDGCWLNDTCINFCFRYFEFEVLVENTNVLFIDPAVVSFVKLQNLDEDDILQVVRSLSIHSRDLLLIPCNDNASFHSGSSHWSLLVIDMTNKQMYHYDSHMGFNLVAAKRTAKKMNQLLKW